jgi:phosphatidylglycerol---prolipoprotein diacylglyceryl transferase
MSPHLRLSEGLTLESYALFFVLAWLIGGAVVYLEVKRRGWPLEKLMFAMGGAVFGAAAGALLSGILFFDWAELFARASALDFVGKSVVGGVIGGYLGVEIAKKIAGYPHSTGDAFALGIPLGHAVGRVGCLLGGCCWGTITSLPWGVRYPRGSLPFVQQVARGDLAPTEALSLPVHPTQIYELLFDLLLFVFLWRARDSLKIRGNLFRLYLLAYAVFRLGLEIVRGDSPFPAIGGPKPVQVLLLLIAIRYAVKLWRDEIALR